MAHHHEQPGHHDTMDWRACPGAESRQDSESGAGWLLRALAPSASPALVDVRVEEHAGVAGMHVSSASAGGKRIERSASAGTRGYRWTDAAQAPVAPSQRSWLSPSMMWGTIPASRADSDDEGTAIEAPGSADLPKDADRHALAPGTSDHSGHQRAEDPPRAEESSSLLTGAARGTGAHESSRHSKSQPGKRRRERALGHAAGPKARRYFAGPFSLRTGLEVYADRVRHSTATVWWQRETVALAVAAGLLTGVRVRSWPHKYMSKLSTSVVSGVINADGHIIEKARETTTDEHDHEHEEEDDEDFGKGEPDESDLPEEGFCQSCLASVNPFTMCETAPHPQPPSSWLANSASSRRSFHPLAHGRVLAARWAPCLLVSKDAVILGRNRRRMAEVDSTVAPNMTDAHHNDDEGNPIGAVPAGAKEEAAGAGDSGSTPSQPIPSTGSYEEEDIDDNDDEKTRLVSRASSRHVSGKAGAVHAPEPPAPTTAAGEEGGGDLRERVLAGLTGAVDTDMGDSSNPSLTRGFSPFLLSLTVFLTDAALPVLLSNILLATGVGVLLSAGSAQKSGTCPSGGLALATWGVVFGGFVLLWGVVRAMWLAGAAAGGRFKPLQWLAAASLVSHCVRAALSAWGCVALVSAVTAVLGRPPSSADLTNAAQQAFTNPVVAACGGGWSFALFGTAVVVATIVHGIAVVNAILEAGAGADVITTAETRFSLDCLKHALQGGSLEHAGPFGASLQVDVPQGNQSRSSGTFSGGLTRKND